MDGCRDPIGCEASGEVSEGADGANLGKYIGRTE